MYIEMLKHGSSPVDWCEDNYRQSQNIAEFANTISNVPFFIMPPILFRLFEPYGRRYHKGVHVMWTLLFVVGICSAYFHATLSLFGQLLDELSILWGIAAAFALWFPSRFLPFYFQKNRSFFQELVFGLAVVTSSLAFWHPAVNAFVLMPLGIAAAYPLLTEIKNCQNSRVLRLGTRCFAVWVVAITCWINDRMFCDAWVYLDFPYLHAVWHVLILISVSSGCVLYAYFDAKNMIPDQKPELRYWPTDRIEFLGIPYVELTKLNQVRN